MPSRLDGPEERKKDLDKRYIPGSKGDNPFRTPLPKAHKKLKGERPNYNV